MAPCFHQRGKKKKVISLACVLRIQNGKTVLIILHSLQWWVITDCMVISHCDYSGNAELKILLFCSQNAFIRQSSLRIDLFCPKSEHFSKRAENFFKLLYHSFTLLECFSIQVSSIGPTFHLLLSLKNNVIYEQNFLVKADSALSAKTTI